MSFAKTVKLFKWNQSRKIPPKVISM